MSSKRLWMAALLLVISVGGAWTNRPASAQAQAPAATKAADSLSAAEFARLQRELSEEGGYFRSDNFTSNETAYLTVVDKLRQLGATGGAYLGVGPEQNYSYIAKIRPRIAFIVDIRRQAIIQHLMYKAIFQLAPDRTQFLARLLSRPLPPTLKGGAPASEAAVNELLAYFSKTPADEQAYVANLAAIRKTIRDDFQVALSEADQTSLEYVYKNFRDDGLEIAYRMDGSRGGYFPSLREIIVQTDLQGKLGNFLINAEDYEFVRNLHRKNLIIPVVGNFAGKKALSGVGDYLRKHNLTLTAFYTSNVEQYLFEGELFTGFAENVRKLPINERTLFIRSATGRYSHPARLPNHRAITLLQQMTIFLKDFDEGKYQTYRDLVSTNYIAPEQP